MSSSERIHNSRVAVIGGGAWGTALALATARAGQAVTLWVRDNAVAAEATTRREMPRLPGLPLPDGIVVTADPARLPDADLWIVALPAQAMGAGLLPLAAEARSGLPVVITAKGIEKTTQRLMTDVLAEVLPGSEPLVLSGPSFARDVAQGLPTAVTLAARSLDLAQAIAPRLSTTTFRLYVSDDLVGVQIGGAIKNVLAIAAGIVAGRGLGDSARAALIARSFAELSRFARAYGARPETAGGLSGLGDLVLSSSSAQSRNFSLGLAIGSSAPPSGALTEGAYSAEAALALAAVRNVDVPIIAAVADVLSGRTSVDDAILRLLQRPLKTEH